MSETKQILDSIINDFSIEKFTSFFRAKSRQYREINQSYQQYDDSDFKKGYYVHKDFGGSASLKKVLPVLVPKLSYKSLNIQEGGNASESWRKMIEPGASAKERKQIYKDLLKYCGLDTMAMVEILKMLEKIIK